MKFLSRTVEAEYYEQAAHDVRTEVRPKRTALPDDAGEGSSPHHGHAKRARRGTLEGGIRVGDNLKKKKHPVAAVARRPRALLQ